MSGAGGPKRLAGTVDPSSRSDPWPKALWCILLVAVVARFWALGRAGLWQDEMGVVLAARPDLGFAELVKLSANYILSIGQMPLTFIAYHLYIKGLQPWLPDIAQNAWSLRLPSALLGVVSVLGLFRLLEVFVDRTRALGASLLFSLLFFPVYYSRELYCYPLVIAAATWMSACAARYAAGKSGGGRYLLGTGLWGIILVYAHLNGVLFFGALALATGIFWVRCLLGCASGKLQARRLAPLLVVWTGVLLAVMPFLLRFLLENKAHTGAKDVAPFIVILQDPVAKMFFGERSIPLIFSWILFGVGALVALRRGGLARWMAAGGLLAWLITAFMTSRNMYLSVRYFAPVAPLFCWFLAEALDEVSRRASRWTGWSWKPIYAGAVALVLAIHFVFFLWPMYGLRDKDLGFGRIADWLNSRLEPGTPYLMESAYELRWVSGHHPTPGLIGAAPYVHGAAPGEVDRLHQRQIAFMQRFPEAPFVQSAHHNWNTPEGVWAWPHQFHPRMERLANEPLRNLVRRGIFIGLPFEKIERHSYATEIYYSNAEDLDQKARAQGQVARAEYPGWTVGQVAQGEYRRLLPGSAGIIRLRKLVDSPTPFRLLMRLALDADRLGQHTLVFSRAGRELVRKAVSAGAWSEVEVPGLSLDAPILDIEFRVEGYPAPRAVVLDLLGAVP